MRIAYEWNANFPEMDIKHHVVVSRRTQEVIKTQVRKSFVPEEPFDLFIAMERVTRMEKSDEESFANVANFSRVSSYNLDFFIVFFGGIFLPL